MRIEIVFTVVIITSGIISEENMVKIAIITRTKDRSVFLPRAIKSIAEQSYSDYVHVIVNDGGDEAAVEAIVAAQTPEVQSKIKLFHRPQPSGAPDTIFNECIDRVDSEYVAIQDDDDSWHKDFLKSVVECLDTNKTAGGVVVRTDKVIEKVEGNSIKILKTERLLPDLEAISLYRQFIDNQLMTNAFVYRRSAYEVIGKYDETLPVVADWEFGMRFLQEFDVEFLNPGFALANYHHRVGAKDNSFSRHSHRKYVTLVANKYLRKELKAGSFGAGYIMSDLKYRQDSRNDFIKRIIPKRVLKVIKRK
jgi:glycosyltransferase involved in cell wall biosynthesis